MNDDPTYIFVLVGIFVLVLSILLHMHEADSRKHSSEDDSQVLISYESARK